MALDGMGSLPPRGTEVQSDLAPDQARGSFDEVVLEVKTPLASASVSPGQLKKIDDEIKVKIKDDAESKEAYEELKADPSFQKLTPEGKKAVLEEVKENPDADSIRDIRQQVRALVLDVFQSARVQFRFRHIWSLNAVHEHIIYGTPSDRAQREMMLREARLKRADAEIDSAVVQALHRPLADP